MSPEAIIAIVGVVLALSSLALVVYKKVPKRIKRTECTKKWRDIQKLCREKHNWPQAILLSDQLLNDVLRTRRVNGKTMGERMVSAQNRFSNNDAIWQAHKLANHIRHTSDTKLKQKDVKEALMAFRQALRDMEAL